MIALVDLAKVHYREDSNKECPVQPSSTLADQFRDRIWYIGFCPCCFNVSQRPCTVTLGNELEAQDAILCEVHVGVKDSRVGRRFLAFKITD